MPKHFLFIVFVIAFLHSGVSFAQKSPYKYYSFSNVQANEVIKGIWKDTTGYIWIATDLGVLTYDGENTLSPAEGLSNLYTKKFSQLSDGQFVVINDSGIQAVVKENSAIKFEPLTYLGVDLNLSMNYPKSIFVDKEGTLWVGESNAVVRVTKAGN